MALEYWELHKWKEDKREGAKIASALRDAFGDVPLPTTPRMDVGTFQMEWVKQLGLRAYRDRNYYLDANSIHLGLLHITGSTPSRAPNRARSKASLQWQGLIAARELKNPVAFVSKLFPKVIPPITQSQDLLERTRIYTDGSAYFCNDQDHLQQYQETLKRGDTFGQLSIFVNSWNNYSSSGQYEYSFSLVDSENTLSQRPELKISMPAEESWTSNLLQWVLSHHIQGRTLRKLVDLQKTSTLINAFVQPQE